MNTVTNAAPGKTHSRKPLIRKSKIKTGAVPGALPELADAAPSILTLIVFDGQTIETHQNTTLDAVRAAAQGDRKVWVDVTGITDAKSVEQMGSIFKLDPLALEDVMTFHQRPKTEEYAGSTFVVTHMVEGRSASTKEQYSLFFAPGFVLTFQEKEGDCLGPVRERLQRPGTRIRDRETDYLAYAIIDTIIDAYFPVVEALGESLEELEDDITLNPDPEQIAILHGVKRDLLGIKRSLWPMREMVAQLRDDDHPRVTGETRSYLRDTQDHVLQLIDIVETYRELGSGLMDLYMTSISNRMNEVMKVLTVISTIFIPLGFLAGVWGMNFVDMPMLSKPWGYNAAMVLMLAITMALVGWFRWKKWL